MDPVNSQVVGMDDEQFSSSSRKAWFLARNKSSKYSRPFLSSIGAHEFFILQTWKAGLAELTASATLMFTLMSSVIACMEARETSNPKLLIPIMVFFIVFLLLMVTIPLSGGLLSPVFTCIAALKGIVTLSRALIYFLAQTIGAIIGFLILKSVMDPKLADEYSLAGCSIGNEKLHNGVTEQNALLVEFACSFVVLFVGITVAFDKKRHKELGLPVICMVVAGAMALSVFISINVTGRPGYTGVGLNPARCLGPALLRGGSLWYGHWIFWIGPLLACIIYYSISINLPKDGLVWIEGEYDILRLAFGSCGAVSESPV